MRYGSVCSGIEAATVAWHPLGWESAFYSEIEPFPCRLLQHYYPQTPNHGDLTHYREWPDESIDLLVGGTPCQSFSVAGLRQGLADPRGNLALVYLGLLDRYRPRWMVWENVPGILSSSGERDFGAFLGGLGQLGYGWAYRVLDAQYLGVAQRRRRVFVVGYLGDWRRAAAVLFEPQSLSGDSPPRRSTGERAAGTLASRTRAGGGLGTDFDCDGGIVASMRGFSDYHGDRPTLRSSGGDNGGGSEALVSSRYDSESTTMIPIADTLRSGGSGNVPSSRGEHIVTMPLNGVRRLTPRECERLQGFPDDYTLIPGAKDGPRYKALGNSMAVPCMSWIGQRIALVDALHA